MPAEITRTRMVLRSVRQTTSPSPSVARCGYDASESETKSKDDRGSVPPVRLAAEGHT